MFLKIILSCMYFQVKYLVENQSYNFLHHLISNNMNWHINLKNQSSKNSVNGNALLSLEKLVTKTNLRDKLDIMANITYIISNALIFL